MTLNDFITALNAKHGSEHCTYGYEQGPKYARVWRETYGQRSAYCFVDADGNVLKAAGWKGPAKGIRANLATLDMSRVDAYTSWLYCR